MLSGCHTHQGEIVHNGRARNAVFNQCTVVLEVENRTQSVRPKDAVDNSCVEAECIESSLKVGDIVAARHRGAQIQQPVSELISRFDQGVPGHRSYVTIAGKTAGTLKCAHRLKSSISEHTSTVVRDVVPKRAKPVLDVPDRLALISVVIEPHGCIVSHWRNQLMYSAISASSCSLERAPVSRFNVSPFLNNMSVGMLITW